MEKDASRSASFGNQTEQGEEATKPDTRSRMTSSSRKARAASRVSRSYASSSEWERCTSTGGVTNHRENLYRYSVHRRADLLERIIPFFREYPLRSAKRLDFEKFASCVEMMAGGQHTTREGLVQIAEIMQTMNRRKPRHELIRILRDHTPEALDTGS
jgi:hypothetical protein